MARNPRVAYGPVPSSPGRGLLARGSAPPVAYGPVPSSPGRGPA